VPRYPAVPNLDLCLFHWTPTSNRGSVKRLGLVPGRMSLQGHWRPPYVAFSDDPTLAWALSGAMFPEINEWDLWMVHYPTSDVGGYEIILDTWPDTGRSFVKEYRIYYRIFKRDLRYVGSRTQDA
jgi:hypothetical protein